MIHLKAGASDIRFEDVCGRAFESEDSQLEDIYGFFGAEAADRCPLCIRALRAVLDEHDGELA